MPYLILLGPRNFYRLYANDVLHQCWNGVCKHLLDLLKVWLDACGLYDEFNRRLVILRGLHNVVVPSSGYSTQHMMAVVSVL